MEYSLKIAELLKREKIRNDKSFEFMNRMNNMEIIQFEREIELILTEENVEKKYPDWNYEFLNKLINREALYKIFIENEIDKKLIRNLS